MGSLYRPKYRGSDGAVKESAVIWLKYRDALGVLRRESSGTEKDQEARRVLHRKEGAAESGRVVAPRSDSITVAQLAEDLKVAVDEDVLGKRRDNRGKRAEPAEALVALKDRRAKRPTHDSRTKVRQRAGPE